MFGWPLYVNVPAMALIHVAQVRRLCDDLKEASGVSDFIFIEYSIRLANTLPSDKRAKGNLNYTATIFSLYRGSYPKAYTPGYKRLGLASLSFGQNQRKLVFIEDLVKKPSMCLIEYRVHKA